MAAVTVKVKSSNRRGKYSKQRSSSDIDYVERVTHRQIKPFFSHKFNRYHDKYLVRIFVRQFSWQFKISYFSDKQQQEKQKEAKTRNDRRTNTQFNLCNRFQSLEIQS